MTCWRTLVAGLLALGMYALLRPRRAYASSRTAYASTSAAVGALVSNRVPAALYKNNGTALAAAVAVAAADGAGSPKFLAAACAAAGAAPSFNAMVLRRMASDRRPALAGLTDKALVRGWAAARSVRSPEALYAGGCGGLPASMNASDYAFKATHTTGCLVIVEGGVVAGHKPCGERRLPVGAPATPALLASLCERWTASMYDVTQWAYTRLEPAVIAERLVYRRGTSTPADDVKCFSFAGRTALVQHVTDRFDRTTGRPKSSSKRDTFYDAKTGFRRGVTVDGQRALPSGSPRALLPKRVRRAAAVCDAVSVGLDMARVDLYDAGDGGDFLLGEITVYPKRGGHAFSPAGVDVELGRAWCRGASRVSP